MSFIGHRCGCGHTDIQHQKDPKRGQGLCKGRAGRPCHQPCDPTDEPQVFATFDSKARPVEDIIEPGRRFPTQEMPGGGEQTCDCDNCHALYAELTA